MKLTVFASGSSGNCCLIQGGRKNILVDAGISAKRIGDALSRAELSPSSLDGIFITHEHSDHIKGLSVFLKKTPVPVYAPGVVAAALCRLIPGVSPYIRPFSPEAPVQLGDLTISAFPTSHDTMQSVGYRFAADGRSIAIATDTGCVSNALLDALSGSDIALLEANYDEQMLRYGPYPAALKRRILSDEGHLSNAECTWLASVLAQRGTGQIILGHLSAHNNVAGLALRTVRRGLEGSAASVVVAPELGFLEVETAPCCV